MLIISKAFLPEVGGIETAIYQIAKTQLENGDDCKALTYSKDKKSRDYVYDGIPVHCMGSIFAKKSLRVSFFLRSQIKKQIKDGEIVLFNYPTLQADFVNRKYKNLYKLVFYHADITKWGVIGKIYQNLFGMRFLKNADKIIVSNPKIIQSSKTLKKYEDKCVVLPFGVDTDKFVLRESNVREKIQNDLDIENKKLILFVGRIARYKGMSVLLESLAQLDDNYRLVIVSNDDVKEKYSEEIASLNVQDKYIQYMGVDNDELIDYYSACDLFVMPSTDRAEAFGIVAIEAMACGLCAITTELGTGTSYHNVDGETGRVIEPKNVKALTEAIVEVCSNPEYYTKEKARKRAEEFSLDEFKRKWTLIIEDVKKEIKTRN